MSRTLFNSGFSKKVELKNGKECDITATLPNTVKLKSKSILLCHFCSEHFSAKQYLDMHTRFKHPESTRPSSAEQIEMDRPNIPLTNATFTTHADLPTIIGSSDSDRLMERG